mmetsp:Transcript_30144/g.66830  ORF Transcript_30144/g.66830 Transcript_30144/m.66830 type:complete len:143 (+) Transcript_30144:508-936(+)
MDLHVRRAASSCTVQPCSRGLLAVHPLHMLRTGGPAAPRGARSRRAISYRAAAAATAANATKCMPSYVPPWRPATLPSCTLRLECIKTVHQCIKTPCRTATQPCHGHCNLLAKKAIASTSSAPIPPCFFFSPALSAGHDGTA